MAEGRRAFLVSAAALPLAPAAALAEAPPLVGPPAPEGHPGAFAFALSRVVEARWGDRLTTEELAAVRRRLQNLVVAGERLRTAELGLADEPATVFSPLSR